MIKLRMKRLNKPKLGKYFKVILNQIIFYFFYSSSLKYLLSQSDIFMHFGATKELNQKIKPEVGKRTLTAAEDEMDEDEKAMAREIGEGDDEEVIDSHNTVLLSQPTIVTGGTLR